MFRNKSVDVHKFAMIPNAQIPRSSFRMQKGFKTTFGGSPDDIARLRPMFCEEMLPGDTFNCRMTAFCRLATPLFPIMDNLYIDTFFFFVPNRLVWENWARFMGERSPDPDSSIDYTVPQIVSPVGGYGVNTLGDYFGLPTVGQVGEGETFSHSALPFRAYNLIYNEWFRDENLADSVSVPTGDGPDLTTLYGTLARFKRHDYFTGCLPWPQKGDSTPLLISGFAPVVPLVPNVTAPTFFVDGDNRRLGATGGDVPDARWSTNIVPSPGFYEAAWQDPGLQADLSEATSNTINQLRQAFQIQRLLERDARGGTRYTEIIRAHFGVVSPDARLQRPEYLGGGSFPISINPVAQTSATAAEGSDTPQGNLAAIGTALGKSGFTYSATEHGYVIGLHAVRADLTYQQGLRRHWSRSTRYDYYFPAFAHLGEQAVLSKEIYCDGTADDEDVFGYQERWAEYRYMPSEITGLFRSTSAGTIDAWHLAQNFTERPLLNNAFMVEWPPISRITAVGSEANGQQFIADMFFDLIAARPMPMYSVPGLIDHF